MGNPVEKGVFGETVDGEWKVLAEASEKLNRGGDISCFPEEVQNIVYRLVRGSGCSELTPGGELV